jgi:hypothetical protein
MRALMISLCIIGSILLKATEQTLDLLIHKTDTIYIGRFPLEVLSIQVSMITMRLLDTTCMTTDCRRQHIGVWMLENDSLFLIGLKDCCDYKKMLLNRIFNNSEIQNGRVFANWYSEKINSGFGKWLAFDEDTWCSIYEKNIEIEIVGGLIGGLIEKCVIRKTKYESEKMNE